MKESFFHSDVTRRCIQQSERHLCLQMRKFLHANLVRRVCTVPFRHVCMFRRPRMLVSYRHCSNFISWVYSLIFRQPSLTGRLPNLALFYLTPRRYQCKASKLQIFLEVFSQYVFKSAISFFVVLILVSLKKAGVRRGELKATHVNAAYPSQVSCSLQ